MKLLRKKEKKVAIPERNSQLRCDVMWKSVLEIIRRIITSELHKYEEKFDALFQLIQSLIGQNCERCILML